MGSRLVGVDAVEKCGGFRGGTPRKASPWGERRGARAASGPNMFAPIFGVATIECVMIYVSFGLALDGSIKFHDVLYYPFPI